MALQGKLKWIGISLGAVAGIALLIWIIVKLTGHSSVGEDSRNRWFIDAESKKPFRAHIEIGQTTPIVSPFTGKNTGYEAELCYWTKEGTIKKDPTPVLVNSAVNPNDKTPTFCPDCGRLVVGHNPPPVEGRPPPLTQEQWTQKCGQRRRYCATAEAIETWPKGTPRSTTHCFSVKTGNAR